jgi:hypothetical protein
MLDHHDRGISLEALAIQIALQEWRTLLYGVPFEVYSDHRSVHYLFSQKNPSQRILRLCEFLSGFNFKEVQYVKGEHAAVPDFFVVRRYSMRSPERGQLVQGSRHTESESCRYVTGMSVWSDMPAPCVGRMGPDGFLQKFLLSKVVPWSHIST